MAAKKKVPVLSVSAKALTIEEYPQQIPSQNAYIDTFQVSPIWKGNPGGHGSSTTSYDLKTKFLKVYNLSVIYLGERDTSFSISDGQGNSFSLFFNANNATGIPTVYNFSFQTPIYFKNRLTITHTDMTYNGAYFNQVNISGKLAETI